MTTASSPVRYHVRYVRSNGTLVARTFSSRYAAVMLAETLPGCAVVYDSAGVLLRARDGEGWVPWIEQRRVEAVCSAVARPYLPPAWIAP